ncbi:meiosis-specific nuclear structural protein 1-like [Culex pipiens pallens]|uniref:meiosis-specific nuclear structural protein 1-like n=1 Tax=Culex pipiens pallens TaxID=42434 RepID=UPI001953299A|nr:meiosis-specific nuclear structural protein 1-like [Culex pipiens pallens]
MSRPAKSASELAVCRVCMSQGKQMVPFARYDADRKAYRLADAISAVGAVQVENGDGLPQYCCVRCLREIESAFKIRRVCQESDWRLREMYQQLEPEPVVEVMKEEKELVFKEEYEESRLQETVAGVVAIKREVEELSQPLDGAEHAVSIKEEIDEFPAPEKRRQLRQTALCREVQSARKQDCFQRDLSQIQRNGQLSQQKRQHTAVVLECDLQAKKRQEEALEEERQKQLEEERELALQLHEANRRRINEEKLRQQLRDSNQELRELESKLRAAYVAKGIAAQKAELEARRLEEQLVAQREQEELEKLRLKNLEFIKQCQEEDWKQKLELRDTLHAQMKALQQQKQVMYEEFLREKTFLDEICRKLQEERFEEIRRKLELQQRTRREMEYFREAKEIWQERQRLAVAEENERIRRYLEARDAEQEVQHRRKLESAKSRERLNEKMVAELQAEFDEARKRENLLQDLYAAELDERQEQRLQRDLEQQLRKRIEARLGIERQLVEIECRRKQQEDEDRRFKEEQLKLWAERDRLDQLSNEKRRLKLMEHRRAIQELLEERRQRRADEVKELMQMQSMFEQEEKRREEIIEEERIKLLKEHVTALLGFLPPGVLRESDREHLPLPKDK